MNRIDFTEKVFSDNRDSRDAFCFLSSVFCFLLSAFCLFCTLSLHAQTDNRTDTRGTDFWLTFGKNGDHPINTYNDVDLQIRIVSGEQNTEVKIDFTALSSPVVTLSVPANQVRTYTLTPVQRQAVYNSYAGNLSGMGNYTVHVTSNYPVAVYALNQIKNSADATNLLPATALGTNYYLISYNVIPSSGSLYAYRKVDAYAVIATQDNTQIRHGNEPPIMLNQGQVYYRTSENDMTAIPVTADKPIAVFTMHQGPQLPDGYAAVDHLFQQLAPVHTWGKNFFVPTSHLGKDRVRIVAAHKDTEITLSGGTRVGGQPTLNNLQPGQWVEVEISRANKGCYIEASKPVGVSSYLTSTMFNTPSGNIEDRIGSDPSETWIPAIEQALSSALVAPFVPAGETHINEHVALIVTPTLTKDNTKVKIGNGATQSLHSGQWHTHAASGMSFFAMWLVDETSSYFFTNNAGLIVLTYGMGKDESYYYLAASAMFTFDIAFYVNDIHFQKITLSDVICDVQFRAEIEEELSKQPGHIKWYIDGIEKEDVRDSLKWETFLSPGEHDVRMVVRLVNEITEATRETRITVADIVLNQPKDIVICAGETVPAISFTGTNVDTVQWEVVSSSGTAIGMVANKGMGTIPAFKAVNNGIFPDTVKITAKPKSADNCKGEPKKFIIVVNPLPVLAQPANLTFYPCETVPAISFTGINVDTVIWTAVNGTATGMSANSGKGSIPSFITSHNGVATITVTPKSSKGCMGEAKTFTVTVNPLPALDPIANITLCAGETVPAVSFTGANIPAIRWDAPEGISIGMPLSSGKGSIPSFMATNTGSTDISVTITAIPEFTNDCEGEAITFTITVKPLPVLTPISDITLCPGVTSSVISFSGNNVNTATTAWDAPAGSAIGMLLSSGTGNIPAFKTINSDTTNISVTVDVTPKSAAGCVGKTETFTITVYHKIDISVYLGNDTTICRGVRHLLDATHPEADSYEWYDQSKEAIYTVFNQEGKIWVIVRSQCNEFRDTINIRLYKNPTVNLGKDLTFCEDEVIYRVLDVTTPNATSYVWQDGSALPTYIVEQTGIYRVTVSNICVSVSDTVEVNSRDCSVLEIWLPNAFTPDGDGVNDVFKPEINSSEYLKEYEMTIYDRWGKLMFITQDYLSGWRGKDQKNRDCSEGVYTGVIRYKNSENQEFIKKFSITLIR